MRIGRTSFRKNIVWTAIFATAAAGILVATVFVIRSNILGGSATRTQITPFAPAPSQAAVTLPAPVAPQGRDVISESNVENIAELARFGRGWPGAAAFAPDGDRLAIGTALGIEIRGNEAGQFQTFYPSDSPILAVQFSPDGKWMAAGRQDGRVLILDAASAKVLRQLVSHSRPVHGLAFSRPVLPGGASDWLASGAEDGSIVVWDLNSGMARSHFLNPLLGYWGYGIRSLAFSPGNKVLVTGGDQGYVSRWDLATGEELPRLQTQFGLIFSIAFSPDGMRLASACGDGTVQIWNYLTDEPLRLLAGHTYGAWSVVWSKDGSELITGAGDGTVRIWEPDTGTLRREKEATFTKIDSLQLSADGSHLAAVSIGEQALQINAETLKEEAAFPDFFSGVRSVSVYPTGDWAALADENGLTYLWNLRQGTALVLGSVRSASNAAVSAEFSPTGGLLAVADGVAGFLRVFDLKSLTPRLEQRVPGLKTIAFSPDGSLVAAGGSPLMLFDLASGTARSLDVSSSPTGLAFLPLLNGRSPSLAASLEDGTVLAWNPADDSQTELASKGNPSVRGLTSSKSLLAAGNDQGDVQLWDVATWNTIRRFAGYSESIFALAISPDENLLAAAGIEGSIRFWSLKSGKLVRILAAHNGWVNGIAFSADGRWILSVGSDGSARIWGVPSGNPR